MFTRLREVVCVVTLAASAPAYAAEAWDCTFTTMPDAVHPTSISGRIKFQIDGKSLSTLSLQFSPKMDTVPIPDYLAGMFLYKVLEDNEVGLVAVNAVSRVVGQIGPVLGATIVTINKSNGELHVGSVTQVGAHDQQHGYCTPNQATP